MRILTLAVAFTALGAGAMAAVPEPNAAPAKPALNRASPMINDPVVGKPVRGKTPSAKTDQDIEANAKDKAPLYRASPMINDPVMPTRPAQK